MEKSGAALARAALREDAAHTGSDAAVILGADTTVVVGDQILGKPTIVATWLECFGCSRGACTT